MNRMKAIEDLIQDLLELLRERLLVRVIGKLVSTGLLYNNE